MGFSLSRPTGWDPSPLEGGEPRVSRRAVDVVPIVAGLSQPAPGPAGRWVRQSFRTRGFSVRVSGPD